MSAPRGATVFFSAGDSSGDLHAAALAERLAASWPEVRMLGMGGPEMEAAGVELCVPQSELAVGGLVELGASAGRIASVWRRMASALERAHPDLVVLVDSGAFNLRFARRVKRRLGAPVLYFVPPQVWAWRRGRARTMARRVDRVAAILPFEVEVYERAGARVEFVGHPLVDRVAAHRARQQGCGARAALGLGAHERVVALLPGSRRNEVAANLPLQLETAQRLVDAHPSAAFAFELAVASSVTDAEIDAALRSAPPSGLPLRRRRGRGYEQLTAADAALLKPGTATLEATLFGTPMVVMGRGNPLSAALVRRLVDIPFWAMPNLLLGRSLVPELLQERAEPGAMADALSRLLFGGEGERQREGLCEAAGRLGPGGAAERTAALAASIVRGPAAAPPPPSEAP